MVTNLNYDTINQYYMEKVDTNRTFSKCSKSNQNTTQYANMLAKSANKLK